MDTTRSDSERATAVLRASLEVGERELARGRVDVGPHMRWVPMGSAHHFAMVTDRRLLWTCYLKDGKVDALAWDRVTSLAQGGYRHRWVVRLRHAITRFNLMPTKSGGPLTDEDVRFSVPMDREESVLEFSRHDTTAAVALRHQLDARAIPEDAPLLIPLPASPEETPA